MERASAAWVGILEHFVLQRSGNTQREKKKEIKNKEWN